VISVAMRVSDFQSHKAAKTGNNYNIAELIEQRACACLSRMYLAHHELESAVIVIIIIFIYDHY